MPVHVSIHDVAPCYARELEQAVLLCRARGVSPALLVVPNFHGQAPLAEAPGFAERLQQLASAGSQILLHGEYHLSPSPSPNEGVTSKSALGRWFRQSVASANEAEFGELELCEASARIDRGLALFARLALPVHGFVPPAWIMPERLLEALAVRRIRYTEDHLSVIDPVTRRRRASLVLNFATRSKLRLWSSVGYARLARALRSRVPLRFAIHPADLRNPLALRETVRLLDWARGDFVSSVEELFR